MTSTAWQNLVGALRAHFILGAVASAMALAVSACVTDVSLVESANSVPLNQMQSDSCEPLHGFARIKAKSACIAYKAYAPSGADKAEILVLYHHGDGGDRIGHYVTASRLVDAAVHLGLQNIAAAVVHRIGYGRSSGPPFDRGYPDWVVDEMAASVPALKAKFGASLAIWVGTSGGAMIGGIIAGKHPGVVDEFVLVAGHFNIPQWRRVRDGGT